MNWKIFWRFGTHGHVFPRNPSAFCLDSYQPRSWRMDDWQCLPSSVPCQRSRLIEDWLAKSVGGWKLENCEMTNLVGRAFNCRSWSIIGAQSEAPCLFDTYRGWTATDITIHYEMSQLMNHDAMGQIGLQNTWYLKSSQFISSTARQLGADLNIILSISDIWEGAEVYHPRHFPHNQSFSLPTLAEFGQPFDC